MLLWYVGGSVALVFYVFRSRGVDYRLVALGALLPLLVDLPFGHMAVGHTLLAAVVLLAVVMLATIGRSRLLRRRLICIPIGVFCGLLLSGAWRDTAQIMWPTLGTEFPGLALLPAWWIVVVEELLGLIACWIMIGVGSLYEPQPRAEFWRTGRIEAHEVAE